MSEITARVETAMLGWDHHEVVTVEHTDYVDLLVREGRLTPIGPASSDAAGPAGEADEPDGEPGAEGAGQVVSEPLAAPEPPARRTRHT